MTQLREADVALVVVAELQRLGYDTYEEVMCGRGSSRADIVGLQGPVTMAVETKERCSARVMEQALFWCGYAHLVVAAVGSYPRRSTLLYESFAKQHGIGIWRVDEMGRERIVREVVPARFRRGVLPRLRKSCRDENRTGSGYAQAGVAGGSYYTPFRGTARALQEVVTDQPGITLKEAIAAIQHHYASSRTARSSLPALIRRGVIRGVRLDESGRALRLFPVEPAP